MRIVAPRPATCVCLGVLLSVWGCGSAGSGADGPAVIGVHTEKTPPAAATTTSTVGANTLAGVLKLADTGNVQTPDVIALGGTDFPSGRRFRLPLSLARKDGTTISADRGSTQIYLAPTPTSPVIGPFPATHTKLDQPGLVFDEQDRPDLYVTYLTVPSPGPYFLVATYRVAGHPSSANVGINILPREQTPAVGSRAPRSDTPTIASTRGDLSALTTAEPPDRSLLQYSVADTLAAHRPVVVTFATPKFCASRLCGPVVQITQLVQRRLASTRLRFIHVEIYTNNDPSKDVNRWVRQWDLPTEPWVFVVDGNGIVRAKFEGAVAPAELEAAARAVAR